MVWPWMFPDAGSSDPRGWHVFSPNPTDPLMNMPARFSVIASLFASITVIAQGPVAEEGDASYHAGYFFNAIELYHRAYAGTGELEGKAVLLFKIAECHRMLGDAEKSAAWYDKATKAHYDDPIAYLHMAEALKVQGRYDEAILVFRKYREKNPGYAAADDAVHDCEQALAWRKEPGRYRVDPEVLLNTPQYDFAPAYADKRNEDLVFTSSRPAATGTSNEGCIGGSTFDLFMSRRDRLGKWSEPVKLPPTICTEANESNAVFNTRRTIMYFTRCPHEKNEALGCDIWMSRKVGNEFVEPVMLPLAPIAITGKKDSSVVVVEHPTLSADDGIMIFTSNMSGGKGGLDLWMVKLGTDGMPLGRATNLGSAIDTKKHDQFPFPRSNGAVFFS